MTQVVQADDRFRLVVAERGAAEAATVAEAIAVAVAVVQLVVVLLTRARPELVDPE